MNDEDQRDHGGDAAADATLEGALAATEGRLDDALKVAATAVSALRRAKGAARDGRLRDLRRSLDAARDAAGHAQHSAVAALDGYAIDETSYLSSGGYTKELLATAEAAGVSMVEEDDRLLCYPSLVQVSAPDLSLLVDRARDRAIRPSVVVARLAAAQQRPPRFKAEPFLDSLRSGYELLVAAANKAPDAVIRLVDIWSVLTLLPGQSRDYSKPEFSRDLYLLDQSAVTSTSRSSRALRWSASTGTKGAGVLTTVARSGQRQVYWGVSFTQQPAAPAAQPASTS